jgi:glycine betaine/proline transport system substrate-binding protein
MKILTYWKYLVILMIAFISMPLVACGKPIITFADEQYKSQTVNNAIARFIIEHGYGYQTEALQVTGEQMESLLITGEIDVEMEGWQQNRMDWYQENINKDIRNLGMTYPGGPQFFIIPEWVAKEYGIETIFDMKDHWELFQDPNDPERGIFYTCSPGSSCRKINSVKLEAYGLYKYYNMSSPDTFDALGAILEDAQKNRQPIFGYYWDPAALMGMYDWHVLQEPPYVESVWEKVKAASEDKIPRPINEACAYPYFAIDKLIHQDLEKTAPEIVEMLKNMNVGLIPLKKTLAWAKENNIGDPEQMAAWYLENYPDRYRSWVPQDIYMNVQKAVRERRGY